MEEEAKSEPFKKRGLLSRSPPKKRTGSFSEIEKKITFEEERERTEGHDKKRKRSQDEETKDKKTKMIERVTTQMMKNKARGLVNEIEGKVSKTAKMDILAHEILELVEQMEIEESIKSEEEKNGGELRDRRVIKGLISKTDTYNQFKAIENKPWPKECFQRTKIKTGNFSMNEGDIIYLRDENDTDMETGSARRLKDSFPELLKMEEKGWETLALSSRRLSDKTPKETWEKFIHVGRKTGDEELFDQFLNLKELMNKQGRTKGILPVDRGFSSPERLAKMMECIFRNTEVIIELYCWEGDINSGKEKKSFRTNAILVKTTAENYVNTLRNVKEDICRSGKQIEFRRIRSARDGNMLIELNEGDTGEEIKKILTKDGNDGDIRILDKERTNGKKYIIRDLDAIISGEEIIGNLKATAINEVEKEMVKLLSIRSAPGETQTATV